MATVTQLRRQLAAVKAQSRQREMMMRRTIAKQAEKRMLQKQLFVLKHPRLVKSAAAGLAMGKTGLTTIVCAAKKYHKYQQAKKGRR